MMMMMMMMMMMIGLTVLSQMEGASSTLELTVQLSGVASIQDVAIDVEPRCVSLLRRQPSFYFLPPASFRMTLTDSPCAHPSRRVLVDAVKYMLDVKLPNKVDANAARASFKRKDQRLTVTLPLAGG